MQVLAVDRKVVADRDAAAGSERQVLALPIVLQDVQRDLERLERSDSDGGRPVASRVTWRATDR